MDNLNKNIKFLRRQAGLTQQAFADLLNIKRSLLGAYEEGRAKPNLSVQLAMTRQFGISLDSLVREDLERSGLESEPALAAPGGLQAGSTRVLSIVVDGNDEEQIVLVSEKARAGYALGYADPEFVAELPRLQLPFLPAGTYRAFEISGDSMLPLQPGSIVVGEYMSDASSLSDGQTYVLLTRSDGMVYKRVFSPASSEGKLVLQSDNPAYPPYELPADELLEAWEAKLSIGKVSKKSDQRIDGMMDMLARLQQEVREIQGRSKHR
ncbi:MAG: helix-turn-helix domain-containing protein [Bacteroidetes bacterium]|nr:helix-turn-helix domain-containing protein [Bacteroidota bacterium]